MVTKTLEWTKCSLGELAHIKTGSRNNEEKNLLGRYPFFVRSAIVERINTYSYDEEAILVPGEGNIGDIFHYIKGRFDAHQRVYIIDHFNEEIEPRFLYWYMKRFFGSYALKNTVKATVDSLRLPTFQSFKVRYPQPPEQRSIAEVLSGFDEHLANLDELIAKKKNIRNGMLEELATGKRRLKGFIGEWTSEMLRNIAVINPKTQLPDSFEYVDLESVKGSELIGTRRFNSEDAPSRAQRVASAGEIFFQLVRPYQRNNYLFLDDSDDVVFSTGYAQIRPTLASSFLFAAIQTNHFVDQVLDRCTGTSYPAITPTDLAEVLVSFPTRLEEQEAIGDALLSVDEEIHALQAERSKVEWLKLGAMDDLLTGRVRLPVEEVDA